MDEYFENESYGTPRFDFYPRSYDWLLAKFVASIHRYRLAHALALNFLLTLNSLAYASNCILSKQIKVTPDAH